METKEELERQIKDTNINPELREQARQKLAKLNAPEGEHTFQGASEGFRR